MISKKKSPAGKKAVKKLKLNKETLKNLDTRKNVRGGARAAADSVLATPWCAPPPDSQKATPWCARNRF